METPFDRITHAMAETSSRPEDLEWAHTAYGYLINGDVKPATAESAVLKVVREIEAGENRRRTFTATPYSGPTEK